MAIWLQIICDVSHSGSGDDFGLICASDRNSNPYAHGSDPGTAYRNAKITAHQQGWKLRNGKWICPGCQNFEEKVI